MISTPTVPKYTFAAYDLNAQRTRLFHQCDTCICNVKIFPQFIWSKMVVCCILHEILSPRDVVWKTENSFQRKLAYKLLLSASGLRFYVEQLLHNKDPFLSLNGQ